ncbi:MAG: hypothetical protein IPJ77_21560 [Planctomycetes bacterium]|nr:hypothetical protein [Planctomycetota bacterium]
MDAAERARARHALSRADGAFLRDEVPEALEAFPKFRPPEKLDHPGGFRLGGAPVRTFVTSALLLAGKQALGHRFSGNAFYERVEEDLALRVMRSHFHNGYPKGAHCCTACTLAVLPVLEANAIRYFDGRLLAKEVRALIASRGWRFAKPINAKMLSWSLSGPKSR